MLCRAGARGSHVAGSRFFCLMEDGAESSSVCNACKRASRSMIYAKFSLIHKRGLLTFFCSRMTLVHFFSKRPLYRWSSSPLIVPRDDSWAGSNKDISSLSAEYDD